MGIFDVNMPLLYGEGHKAFLRLQKKIMKQDDDQSLFAWTAIEPITGPDGGHGLLADSPAAFGKSGHIRPYRSISNIIPRPFSSRGVSVALSLLERSIDDEPYRVSLGVLECYKVDGRGLSESEEGRPAVVLKPVDNNSANNHYTRIRLDRLVWVNDYTEPSELFVRQLNGLSDRREFVRTYLLHFSKVYSHVDYVDANGSCRSTRWVAARHGYKAQYETYMRSEYTSMVPSGEPTFLPWKGLNSGGLYSLSSTSMPCTLSAVILFADLGGLGLSGFFLLVGTQQNGDMGFEIREAGHAELKRMPDRDPTWLQALPFQPVPPGTWMVLPRVRVMVVLREMARVVAPGIKYFRPELHIRDIMVIEASVREMVKSLQQRP